MGGGITNMAAVKHGLVRYDPEVVQGIELDAAEIDRQIDLYRTRCRVRRVQRTRRPTRGSHRLQILTTDSPAERDAQLSRARREDG